MIDPAVKADFEGIAKLHDGDFAVVNRTSKDDVWLVAFTSDRGPTAFYRWDRTAKKGDFMFFSQPKLSGLALSAMKPVVIRSRDGLNLHSYLTLPAGLPPKNLPMVLFVHGGPWGRDIWGYNPYAQWLANRGYAVPPGQLPRFDRLREDVPQCRQQAVGPEDARRPDRRRRNGPSPRESPTRRRSRSSAARTAATPPSPRPTFTPEFFACNVDIVGPSNLKTLIASIPPYWKPMRAQFDVRMGNVDDPKDAELIRNASPLFKADRITKPLLIGQGANDPRVNVKESEQIVEAIEKNKGSVTYVLYPDEGHGFARPENRIDFNARAEKFLVRLSRRPLRTDGGGENPRLHRRREGRRRQVILAPSRLPSASGQSPGALQFTGSSSSGIAVGSSGAASARGADGASRDGGPGSRTHRS